MIVFPEATFVVILEERACAAIEGMCREVSRLPWRAGVVGTWWHHYSRVFGFVLVDILRSMDWYHRRRVDCGLDRGGRYFLSLLVPIETLWIGYRVAWKSIISDVP